MIFYIMGKSATGKDHVCRMLLKEESLGLKPMILHTTRPMREGEKNGREYFFTDEAEMRRLADAGKIIECRQYHTANGVWSYFTVDDDHIAPAEESYAAIGTLESYVRIREYFGEKLVVPLYIETEDGLRLEHALRRERKQERPDYVELCRRFIADTQDFSEAKIRAAGIRERISNNGSKEELYRSVLEYIYAKQRKH